MERILTIARAPFGVPHRRRNNRERESRGRMFEMTDSRKIGLGLLGLGILFLVLGMVLFFNSKVSSFVGWVEKDPIANGANS